MQISLANLSFSLGNKPNVFRQKVNSGNPFLQGSHAKQMQPIVWSVLEMPFESEGSANAFLRMCSWLYGQMVGWWPPEEQREEENTLSRRATDPTFWKKVMKLPGGRCGPSEALKHQPLSCGAYSSKFALNQGRHDGVQLACTCSGLLMGTQRPNGNMPG